MTQHCDVEIHLTHNNLGYNVDDESVLKSKRGTAGGKLNEAEHELTVLIDNCRSCGHHHRGLAVSISLPMVRVCVRVDSRHDEIGRVAFTANEKDDGHLCIQSES